MVLTSNCIAGRSRWLVCVLTTFKLAQPGRSAIAFCTSTPGGNTLRNVSQGGGGWGGVRGRAPVHFLPTNSATEPGFRVGEQTLMMDRLETFLDMAVMELARS